MIEMSLPYLGVSRGKVRFLGYEIPYCVIGTGVAYRLI